MESQTVSELAVELGRIRETHERLEREVARLAGLVERKQAGPSASDYAELIGLGTSGAQDISEEHDRYLGDALAHEHLG